MDQFIILQHLSINQIKRKPMGDQQSKPIENQQLRHLQQQYQPFSKGKLMPGEPIYLKLNSIFQKSEYSDKINNRFKKIQRYQMFKRYTERSLQQDQNIYNYRRTNLPCIVQAVYFCIEKEECQCSTNAHKVILYLEHVQTRLAHYKTTKTIQNDRYQSIQYYHPFTLEEGIYVLINTLHAYQLLSQQFFINYPSPLSIGINNKAQVKVWINDNWSLNDQNHRKLSQNIIIQEIINIIEERMESNFNTILNVSANYMNFNFTSIQDILSRHTISYQKGKKSLEDRLNNGVFIKQGDKSLMFSDKIPLGKQRQSSIHTGSNLTNNHGLTAHTSNAQDVTKSSQSRQGNEKRNFSQQVVRNTIQPLIPNSARPFSSTPRTTVQESPKKVIKFTYQHSMSDRQSPKISSYIKESLPVSPFNQNFQKIPQSIYSNAPHIYQNKATIPQANVKQNGFGKTLIMPNNITGQHLDKAAINNLIDKKLKGQTQSSNRQQNSGKIAMTNTTYRRQNPNFLNALNYNFDQKHGPEQNASNIIIKPFQIYPQQQKKVHYEFHEDKIQKLSKQNSRQLNKSSENASLTQITQQFKHLLKSEHKIEQKQHLFYDYEDEQEADSEQQIQKECLKTGQEKDENNHYTHSFYDIKEEDDEVSYSIDEAI